MSNKVFLVQIYTLLSFYDVGYKKHSIFSNVLVHQDTPRIIKMLRFSSIFKETLFHEKKKYFYYSRNSKQLLWRLDSQFLTCPTSTNH